MSMPPLTMRAEMEDLAVEGSRSLIPPLVVSLLPEFDQPTPVCIATAEVFDTRTGQAGIIIVNSHPVR